MIHLHQNIMRTTLTLDQAVAERVRQRMNSEGGTLKSVINDALREGLRVLEHGKPSPPKFVVKPHAFGLRPGIDPDKIGQYADDLEDEEILAKMCSDSNDSTDSSPGGSAR